MKRKRLRSNYPNNSCDVHRKTYNAQRNLCVSLVRKAKLDYYNKLNHKKVSDNKTFWKTVKPFFTNKGVNHDRILLVEENETISDNDEISEKLNNFFADIVKNFNIPQYEDHLVNTDNSDDPILRAKEKSKNHESIQLIKCHYDNKNNTFCFSNITHTEVEKELKLDSSKSSPNSDIPIRIVKDNIDIFTAISHQEFNKSLELSKFPSEMKLSDVTPVFKTEDRTNKENHRPISILSNFSKVFERCLYNQLSVFFDKIFSKY